MSIWKKKKNSSVQGMFSVFTKAEWKVSREKLTWEMVWKSVHLVQFVPNNSLKAREGEEQRELTESGLVWCK